VVIVRCSTTPDPSLTKEGNRLDGLRRWGRYEVLHCAAVVEVVV